MEKPSGVFEDEYYQKSFTPIPISNLEIQIKKANIIPMTETVQKGNNIRENLAVSGFNNILQPDYEADWNDILEIINNDEELDKKYSINVNDISNVLQQIKNWMLSDYPSESASVSSQVEDNLTEGELINNEIINSEISNNKNVKIDEESELKRRFCDQKQSVYKHSKTPMICDICNTTFARKKDLKIHILIHMALKPFQCAYCSESFTVKYLMINHLRDTHSNQIYSCHLCYKSFLGQCELDAHLSLHEQHKEKQKLREEKQKDKEKLKEMRLTYKCEICKETFSSLRRFKFHLSAHSSEGCQACKVKLRKIQIKIATQCLTAGHMDVTTKYSCDRCKKLFRRQGTLIRHKDIHCQAKKEL